MKWEYKVFLIQSMTASDLTKELNKYGNEGWRLIQVHAQGTSFMAIFLRGVNTTSAKTVDKAK